MAIVASEAQSVSKLSQLNDSVVTTPYKWFSLASNKLDGTYHPMTLDMAYQVGWWGTSVSASTGALSSNPYVIVDLPTDIVLSTLIVVGDPNLDEYPVDFTIDVLNSSGISIWNRVVTDNTQVYCKVIIGSPLPGGAKIKLTVSKINKPNSVVKIVEFYFAWELYSGDTLLTKIADIRKTHTVRTDATDTILTKISDLDKQITVSGIKNTDNINTLLLDALHTKQFVNEDTLLPEVADLTCATEVHALDDDIILLQTVESLKVHTVHTTNVDTLTVGYIISTLPNPSLEDDYTTVYNSNGMLVQKPSGWSVGYGIDNALELQVTEELVEVKNGEKALHFYAVTPSPTNFSLSLTCTDFFAVDETKHLELGFWFKWKVGYRDDISVTFYNASGVSIGRRWARATAYTYTDDDGFTYRSFVWQPSSGSIYNDNVQRDYPFIVQGAVKAKVTFYVNWHVAGTHDVIIDEVRNFFTETLPTTEERRRNSKISSDNLAQHSVHQAKSDAILVRTDDTVRSMKASLQDIDILLPTIADVVHTTEISLSKVDNILTQMLDTPHVQANLQSDDQLTVVDSVILHHEVSLSSIESAPVGLQDVRTSHDVSFVQTDQLLPTISDTNTGVTNSFGNVDSLDVIISDLLAYREFYTTDELVTLVQDFLREKMSGTKDSMNIATDDVSNPVTNKLDSVDTLLTQIVDAFQSIHNSFVSQDILKVMLLETVNELINPIVIIPSETHPLSQLEQVKDGELNSSYKWFSLDGNKLDGSYHPMNIDHQIGWWGTSRADASGLLSSTPSIIVDLPRDVTSVYTLIVSGDTQRDEYPVDFIIALLDADDNAIWSKQVTGNTSVIYRERLASPTTGAHRLQLTVTKINKPGVVLKVVEFFCLIEKFGIDGLLLNLDVSSILSVYGYASDVLLPAIADVRKSHDVSAKRTDELKPKIADIHKTHTVQSVLTDELTPIIVDLRHEHIVQGYVGDVLTPSISDNVCNTEVRSYVQDTLATQVDDILVYKLFAVRDDVKILITEQLNSIMASLSTADSLITLVDEVQNTSVSHTSSDVLIATLTDTPKYKLFASLDALANTVTENPSVLSNYISSLDTIVADVQDMLLRKDFSNADVIRTQITDLLNQKNFASVDNVYTQIDEGPLVTTNSFSSLDICLLKISEGASTLQNSFVCADTVKVLVTDRTLNFTNILVAADLVLPLVVDNVKASTHKMYTADVLKPKISDKAEITALLQNQDTILVRYNVEDTELWLQLNTSDTLAIESSLQEVKRMTNVHTQMDSDVRKVFGKVEITYTDVFLDQSIITQATEIHPYTLPEQTADNLRTPSYRWFTLHDNTLDGSCHPMSVDVASWEVGWWSTSISDASGNFAIPPELSILFDPRSIFILNVTGDSLANMYPTNFTIKCYNGTTEIYSLNVPNNTQVDWRMDISLTPIINCTHIKLIVHTVNKPHQPCRILEFITSVVQVYTDEDRLSFMRLLEEREVSDGTLPVGNVTSNEVDIRLDNTDRYFDALNPKSPVATMMKPNRRVRVWLGTEIIPGDIEWHLLGKFWTIQWSAPKSDVYVTITARDILNLMSRTKFINGDVMQDATLYDLGVLVLEDFGLLPGEYYVDPALQNAVVPFGWFDRMSHREALIQIARAGLAVVNVDNNGVVRIDVSTTPLSQMTVLDDDVNIYSLDNPQDWTQVINTVNIKWISHTLAASKDILSVDNLYVEVPAGQDTTLTFEFNEKPVVYVDSVVIGGDANVVLVDYHKYSWGIDITVHNNGATTEMWQSILVMGQPLTHKVFTETLQDDVLVRDLGVLNFDLESSLIQTKQLASTIGTGILASYKDPQRSFNIETRGDISLNLGDLVGVNTDSGQKEAIITSQVYEFDGALKSTLKAVKVVREV